MVFKCKIKFDENPYGVYFSGKTVSGRIEVFTDEIKKVRGVYLQVSGFAMCYWTEKRIKANKKNLEDYVNISYSGREEFMEATTYLIGSKNGNSIEIPIGTHSYNFGCPLPPTIPTSFDGEHGHIRYLLTVVFDRPWTTDVKYKAAFPVLKPLDLNADSPGLKIPSQMEITKTFCGWPFRSAPLIILATIPQSGYVPGEQIDITVSLVNKRNVNVNEIKFGIQKLVYYRSQTPHEKTKTEITDVVEHFCNDMPTNFNGKVEKKLLIPSLPPTNSMSRSVINIMYELVIEIKATGTNVNAVLRIPITIGTVPLNRNLRISANSSPEQLRPSHSRLLQNPPEIPPRLRVLRQDQTVEQHSVSQTGAVRFRVNSLRKATAPLPPNI